jgi:hypothetical protein
MSEPQTTCSSGDAAEEVEANETDHRADVALRGRIVGEPICFGPTAAIWAVKVDVYGAALVDVVIVGPLAAAPGQYIKMTNARLKQWDYGYHVEDDAKETADGVVFGMRPGPTPVDPWTCIPHNCRERVEVSARVNDVTVASELEEPWLDHPGGRYNHDDDPSFAALFRASSVDLRGFAVARTLTEHEGQWYVRVAVEGVEFNHTFSERDHGALGVFTVAVSREFAEEIRRSDTVGDAGWAVPVKLWGHLVTRPVGTDSGHVIVVADDGHVYDPKAARAQEALLPTRF